MADPKEFLESMAQIFVGENRNYEAAKDHMDILLGDGINTIVRADVAMLDIPGDAIMIYLPYSDHGILIQPK